MFLCRTFISDYLGRLLILILNLKNTPAALTLMRHQLTHDGVCCCLTHLLQTDLRRDLSESEISGHYWNSSSCNFLLPGGDSLSSLAIESHFPEHGAVPSNLEDAPLWIGWIISDLTPWWIIWLLHTNSVLYQAGFSQRDSGHLSEAINSNSAIRLSLWSVTV